MNSFRAIFLAGVVCSLGGAVQAQSINGIRAVVHDSVVTFQQVQDLTAPLVDTLQRQYRYDPDLLQTKYKEASNESLEKLIERQLILHDFQSAGYNLPESIIDEEVQSRIRSRFGDRAKLTKTLQAEGITYEKFRQQLRENFIEQALRGRNVASSIMISPHKIEVYYAAHQSQFKVEDEVKLRMIVLNKSPDDPAQTVTLANDICNKIIAGAKFADMASAYSQGSQRSQGGDWGWVERSVLRKELAETAFTLPVGKLSDVIETPDACYLMLVEDKRAEHFKPLSEVREEIERTMLTQERTRLEQQWIDKLRKKTFVRYF